MVVCFFHTVHFLILLFSSFSSFFSFFFSFSRPSPSPSPSSPSPSSSSSSSFHVDFLDGDHKVFYCNYQGVEEVESESGKSTRKYVLEEWEHSKRITAVAFRPPVDHNSTTQLAVGDRAHLVTVRDIDRGKIVATFKHEQGLNALAWSHDGMFLATGDMAYKVIIRDINNGQIVSEYCHHDKVMSVDFLWHESSYQTMGHIIAASDKSGLIAIRSMTRGQVVSSFPHDRTYTMSNTTLSATAGGTGTATATATESSVETKTSPQSKAFIDTESAHINVVNGATFSPDDQWMVIVDRKQELTKYDVNTEKILDQYKHMANIRSVACSQNYVVVGLGDQKDDSHNKVVVHDAKNLKNIVKEWKHDSRVVTVDIYDSEPHLIDQGTVFVAACDRCGLCVVRELIADVVVHTFKSGETMNSVCFSPWRSDGVEYIATGDTQNKVIVRTMSNGRIYREWLHEAWVNCVSFSPGKGDYIAAGDDANKVIVYDISTGQKMANYEAEAEINCIAFSEGSIGESMLLALGDDDNNIVLRDINNGGLVVAQFNMHRPVTCLAFTQNDGGSLLVAGDKSGQVVVRTNPLFTPPNRVSQCGPGLLTYMPHLGIIPLLDDVADPLTRHHDPNGHTTDFPLCEHSMVWKECPQMKCQEMLDQIMMEETKKQEEHQKEREKQLKAKENNKHHDVASFGRKIVNTITTTISHTSSLVKHNKDNDDNTTAVGLSTSLDMSEDVTTTTLFHYFSYDELLPIVKDLPLYAKICRLSTRNPRLKQYSPPKQSCLELALYQQDHLKLAMLSRLIDLAYDYALSDDSGSRAKWMASLAGKNDDILVELLERSVVPTQNIADESRMKILEPVIMPSIFQNPSWLYGDGNRISYLFRQDDFKFTGKPPISVETLVRRNQSLFLPYILFLFSFFFFSFSRCSCVKKNISGTKCLYSFRERFPYYTLLLFLTCFLLYPVIFLYSATVCWATTFCRIRFSRYCHGCWCGSV